MNFFCAKILSEEGFKDIKLTKLSGDYGGDIVATSCNGYKYVVQCKRYKESVGVSAIQEVLGSIGYYKCDDGFVMREYVPQSCHVWQSQKAHSSLYALSLTS